MANDQTTKNEQVVSDDIDAVAGEAEQVLEAQAEEVVNADAANSGEQGSAIDELSKQLAAAQQEAADLKEQMLRAAADVQNVRRRAEQDVEKAHKFALDKFVNEMLPIVDSLERTLEACNVDDEATKSLREGVEMTHGMFISGLAKFKVERVDPQGEAFDPVLHQAMSLVDAPDAKPNTVVAVMQKGYTLNGRLVRPAMVMVSKS
ncbi:nucleotide exchange factor GrpE [Neptunomonas qingdaonensis]|uniref:Protein GrpE n=1 Tax=Neptunomonas qingdaonensis TaxID=1045558 RepID=A0A1I2MHS3_9GAMM|nr:nucleotide exchange factor GrpE [Neptunomonas qingdaonensis]SFF88926.1 molecular chaperone GrpE [Neptunomonas qingdaonensis]